MWRGLGAILWLAVFTTALAAQVRLKAAQSSDGALWRKRSMTGAVTLVAEAGGAGPWNVEGAETDAVGDQAAADAALGAVGGLDPRATHGAHARPTEADAHRMFTLYLTGFQFALVGRQAANEGQASADTVVPGLGWKFRLRGSGPDEFGGQFPIGIDQ